MAAPSASAACWRFNEARALSAGSYSAVIGIVAEADASMRPAH